jgi:hypothetical protein
VTTERACDLRILDDIAQGRANSAISGSPKIPQNRRCAFFQYGRVRRTASRPAAVSRTGGRPSRSSRLSAISPSRSSGIIVWPGAERPIVGISASSPTVGGKASPR